MGDLKPGQFPLRHLFGWTFLAAVLCGVFRRVILWCFSEFFSGWSWQYFFAPFWWWSWLLSMDDRWPWNPIDHYAPGWMAMLSGTVGAATMLASTGFIVAVIAAIFVVIMGWDIPKDHSKEETR